MLACDGVGDDDIVVDIFYLSEFMSHESTLVLFYSSVLSGFSFEDSFGAERRFPFKTENYLLPGISGARVSRPFFFSARVANLAIPGRPCFMGRDRLGGKWLTCTACFGAWSEATSRPLLMRLCVMG